MLDEALDRRLDQPDPAVIAVEANVADELVDGIELRAVVVGEDDLH
jgi:hypothetical protein